MAVPKDLCRYLSTSRSCFKGIFANVWHTLSDEMNFTFTVKRAYMWGAVTNGTWNGMVGMLKNETADIAAADLTITKERSTVVDFLPSLMEVTEGLYMKNPGDGFSTVSYVGSFTWLSWILLLTWMTFIPLALVGLSRAKFDRKESLYSLFESYVFVVSSMLNLGYVLKSDKIQNRIALASVVIGGMLIFYHWEAELTSHLAFKITDLPFNNLHELSQDSKFKFIVAKGPVHLDYFKNSDDPLRKRVWQEKLEPYADQLPSLADIPKMIQKDAYTVAYYESTMNLIPAYINCDIVDIRPPIRKTRLAFATRENFPFFHEFKHHINKLKQVGLVQKYINSYKMEDQICKDYSGEPVTIQQCFSAFQILAAGMTVALLGFVTERFVPLYLVKGYYTSDKALARKMANRKQKCTRKLYSKKDEISSLKKKVHRLKKKYANVITSRHSAT